MQEFLEHVLTESSHTTGCGMSTRPGYYSGRGATRTDLNSEKLERIHAAILKNKGEDAAKAFIEMVVNIPVLSATDFLIALTALDASDYNIEAVWGANLGSNKGIYLEGEGEAWGTIGSVLGGMADRDETPSIRGPFLRRHGVRSPDKRVYVTNDGRRIRWGDY
jgi:hypothetical protein